MIATNDSGSWAERLLELVASLLEERSFRRRDQLFERKIETQSDGAVIQRVGLNLGKRLGYLQVLPTIGLRFADVTPIARKLPPLACAIAFPRSTNVSWSVPASRSFTARGMPLYGTWSTSMLARVASCAMHTCELEEP